MKPWPTKTTINILESIAAKFKGDDFESAEPRLKWDPYKGRYYPVGVTVWFKGGEGKESRIESMGELGYMIWEAMGKPKERK